MPSHTARIADLSTEKQALLLKLIKERSISVNQTISKRVDFSPCPLSFAQERLWFLAQMEPDNPFYNMAGVAQLQGNLNIPVLEQALNEVVRRHEALRTSFRIIDNEVRQVLNDSAAIIVGHIDLTGLSELQQEDVVKTLEVQEAQRIFDLEQTPLLRAVLAKLGDGRYVLLMTLHHIVSDEWSLRLLIKEVGACYETFKSGNPSSEPELPIQYADFAVWQRNRLQGELYDRQIAYWRQHLEIAPKALELPTDRARLAVMSYHGANHEFELTGDTLAALVQLSRQADTTLFAVMMATFTLLLSRYSGQNDICVGYPIANRNRGDIENLIGFFVNTLVLRTDLSGNPTFTELLSRVRENILDAQNNQDLPFERLVEELKLERELNRTPLFQVMLVYQNAPMDELSVSELHFKMADAQMDSAKFDLTLNVSRSENKLRCSFNYSTDLFDGQTIDRMANHFQILLAGIVRQPEVKVSELPILGAAERQQLLAEWSHANTGYPKHLCIHQLFEQQVQKTPDAIAVVFEDQNLSYAELNCRANRVAHYLLALGIRPDDRVAICAERSLEMIVGLLGILKAGGAYVPLDPNYPAERLAYMLGDSAPVALLTQTALHSNLSGLVPLELPILLLDTVSGTTSPFALYPIHNPDPEALGLTAHHLAYIIYTSGSTGLPKGVMVEHAQVVRLFAATQDRFRFDSTDVWTLFHSFAFDFSVWELWGALTCGGRLILVAYDTSRSPEAFYALLCREGVTVLNQTPSAFRQLVAAQTHNPEPHALRYIVFGGEALDFHSLAPWVERNGLEHTQLINMYGITEITVHATYYRVVSSDINAQRGSVVGRPLPDLSLYLLDAHMQPVPLGVTGEIYIGGAGIARGYLNRPDLTAERFISDPFKSQGRLYKTGDLGRWLPDGNVEYLGRNDFQVKIRGFRIELGEIEEQLVACDGVRDAVVIAREDSPGSRRLVAYLIAQDSIELSPGELRAQLATVLADYMLPSAFVTLTAFPLTSNGKLDRQALPEPDGAFVASRSYEAPQGAVETAVAGIWQELLGLEQVGRHDNFFELGGHSLMLVGLIEPLRRQGFTANMRMVFAAPTLAAMADAVSNAGICPVASAVPPNLIPDNFAQSLTHSITEEFRL